MALRPLTRVQVIQPISGSGFNTDDVVSIYWDDSAEQIVMERNGSPFNPSSNTYLGEYLSNYIITWPVSSYEDGYAVSSYSFCDGANLVWFRMLLDYATPPYMAKQITANSPVCAVGGGPVCDIHWVGTPVVTHATSLSNPGSVKVTAQSSNGTVKYHVGKNLSYSQMTNTTGEFDLPPGDWIIYAKDINECELAKQVKILYKPTDTEHYRFTWSTTPINQQPSTKHRIRIYEREYMGDVVEVKNGSRSPFVVNKPLQGSMIEKMSPVHPTHAVLSLSALEDNQFIPLFTQDDRKYRVVHEVDEGGGFTPVWQGFVLPSVYLEPFVAAPYHVEISITDNIALLQRELFTDDDGNLLSGNMKLIKVIAYILKKTGLSLKIRQAINIFEENHDSAASSDDPLDQTYVDVACYRDSDGEPFTCWEVLEHILRPFGARLHQANNQWVIYEVDRGQTPHNYRIFSADGDYESNGSVDPVKEVKPPVHPDRVALMNQDHTRQIMPAFGQIEITSRLNYAGSIVAGGFEKEDLLSPEMERPVRETSLLVSEEGFRDWTLRLNGTTGVSFGRALVTEEDKTKSSSSRQRRSSRVITNRGGQRTLLIDRETKRSSSKARSVGAFFYLPQDGWSGNLRDAYIESAPKGYEYGPGDVLRFRFDHSSPSHKDYPFMTLRFMLKLGNYYLQPDRSWSTSPNVFRAYPNKSGTMQSFELSVDAPQTTTVVDTTIQVRIYFYAPEFYDFGLPPTGNNPTTGTNGLAALKAFPTTGINYDYQLETRVHETFGPDFNEITVYYRLFSELVYGAISGDFVVQPDDYSSNNPKKWRPIKVILEMQAANGRTRGLAHAFYIDDVAVDPLPGGMPPPEDHTISHIISKSIDDKYGLELYHFDLPDIVNGKYMYNNYFRLSDGTPTAKWARSGVAESLSLQEILLRVLVANHSAPTFKIRGAFMSEYFRITPDNYIKLTQAGADFALTNTDFDSDLNGWLQSDLPFASGIWSWTSNNDGSARVLLMAGESSKKLYQAITHNGGFVEIDVRVQATGNASSTREDALSLVFYQGSSVIHTERMATFTEVRDTQSSSFKHVTFVPANVTGIGLYIQYVNGGGSRTYDVSEFNARGEDLEELYAISDYSYNAARHSYELELVQMSKGYITLEGIDTGGTGQIGSTIGREYSSAYSSAYS